MLFFHRSERPDVVFPTTRLKHNESAITCAAFQETALFSQPHLQQDKRFHFLLLRPANHAQQITMYGTSNSITKKYYVCIQNSKVMVTYVIRILDFIFVNKTVCYQTNDNHNLMGRHNDSQRNNRRREQGNESCSYCSTVESFIKREV